MGYPTEHDYFIDILGWWFRLCFAIGLPLAGKNFTRKTKLFTATLLLCHLTIALIPLTCQIVTIIRNTRTTAVFKFGSSLAAFSLFIKSCGLHISIVWKIGPLRQVIQMLNETAIVDVELRKFLKVVMCTGLCFLIFTVLLEVWYTTSEGFYQIDFFPPWNVIIWALWGLSSAYAITIGYTISLLIATLGYQFSKLNETIQSKPVVSCDRPYERHERLCELAGDLQNCIVVSLVISFCSLLVHLCTTGSYVTIALGNAEFSSHILCLVVILSENCLRCGILCVAGDYLSSQAHSLAVQVAKADVHLLHDPEAKKSVNGLGRNVLNLTCLTTLTVGGFCRLGKSLLLTILATFVTCFVLLSQTLQA